ncbi:unnamed protein product [Peronospora belbahrii]|uniref:Uncharacterized protein n=1 Tax=Peronospora belbahrii TaxID=622444 RepID=A0AAU9LD03_9STRA|nr:unnamed protein product [Peronospora belbahrii]CAH0519145.1 unnamed protein product [Peronospora belbahrii]
MANSTLPQAFSVGEYDVVTGLTYITHQRGRLLFNMGSSTKKQQYRESTTSFVVAKRTLSTPRLLTGPFTGLSLYPEEAYYLLKRQALVIYLVTLHDIERQPLSIVEFTTIIANDTRVSLACLEVYAFLKDEKLHPRRCLNPLKHLTTSSEDMRSLPRHMNDIEPCDVAFDVWKTIVLDDLPSEMSIEVEQAKTGITMHVTGDQEKKRKHKKTFMLVFRVAVCRFEDAAPSLRSFRDVMRRSKAREDLKNASLDHVPVKIAVVHHDQSVLMYEISNV